MFNEKIEAKMVGDVLDFGCFIVKKESDNFYGVYDYVGKTQGELITSGSTMKKAAKKAKLLQIGFEIGSGFY